jgi:hypothetical protein
MTIRKLEVSSPPWVKVRKRGGIQEAVIMSHSKHGSGLQRRVVWEDHNVSEEIIASVFRVEE